MRYYLVQILIRKGAILELCPIWGRLTTGRDSISVGVVPLTCSPLWPSVSRVPSWFCLSLPQTWTSDHLSTFYEKKYRYHSYSIFSQEDSNPFKKNLKIWCYYTNNQFGTEGKILSTRVLTWRPHPLFSWSPPVRLSPALSSAPSLV